MIEVLDIQRNFKDGTEIIKRKMKDNTLTRGKATIQLFDENNNLIEETVSNNFIKNPASNADLYYHLSTLIGTNDISKKPPARFQQIQLRSGDFEEDPKELFARGRVVGYCPRTSTDGGTDVLRGIYSPNESFEEFTQDGYYHCHLVYDFSTTQANGEFNHIYWAGTPAGTGNKIFYSTSYDYDRYGTQLPPMYIDAFGNYLYEKNGQFYKIKNKKQIVNGLTKNIEYNELEPVEFIRGTKKIDGNNYFDHDSNYSQGNLANRACNVTFKIKNENHEIVKEKTIDILGLDGFARLNERIGSNSSAYIKLNKIHGVLHTGIVYFSIYAYSGSSSNKVIPTVSEDGSYTETATSGTYILGYDLINDTWLIEPNPYSYICNNSSKSGIYSNEVFINKSIGEGLYLTFSGTNIYLFDTKDLSMKSVDKVTNNGTIYNRGIDFENNVCMCLYSDYSYIYRFAPYSSHTKLPNPVVKTNNTTMKITYDYYIQVPDMFAEEGEEFNWE